MSDNFDAPRVAIISELMAKRYWRNNDPVGKRIQLTNTDAPEWITIVGIASDLKQSWFIGDTTTDVQTARNAGVKSILVRTGSAGKDGKHDAQPDFTFDNLKEAVDFILSQKP